jgi:hypothetical protein
MKFEIPELEHFYLTICNYDFYAELKEEKVIKNMETDKFDEETKETKEINNKLEKVQIKYSNSEDYIRIYFNLFLLELKAQITRSKIIEVINC